MPLRSEYLRTLEASRRRSRLTGREAPAEETEAISRGYFGGAGERMFARKGLALVESGREFETSERLGRQEFAAGEAVLGREFTTGERVGGQEFFAGEAVLGRTHQTGLQARGIASAEAMHGKDIDLGYYTAREQISAAGQARKQQQKTSAFQVGGMALGAVLGIPGGPMGMAVGAGLGAAAGSILGGCIIISACTDLNSNEVNITRRYRDKIMLPGTLRGYYMIAEKVVPLIHKSDKFKRFIKKHLVDSLAATCEWKLKETNTVPSLKARIVTGLFLGSCNLLGNTKQHFVRCNGEVF